MFLKTTLKMTLCAAALATASVSFADNSIPDPFAKVKIENGKIVDADFYGGCNGNLKGIKSLITGMKVDDVIEKLSGITCGMKTTSCPDQLAKCLIEYKQGKLTPVMSDEM